MSSAPPFELPPRASAAHKGNFGRVVLVGGSRGMAGSIALSCIAALKSGSGLVSAAIPDRCLETVASFHPAVMTIPVSDDDQGSFSSQAAQQVSSHFDSADAVAIGPGMRTGPGALRMVDCWVGRCGTSAGRSKPMVVDADGLNGLAKLKILDRPDRTDRCFRSVVLTPHAGELQRLTGVSSSDRAAQIDAAVALAERFGVTIVVKGGPTVVVGKAEGLKSVDSKRDGDLKPPADVPASASGVVAWTCPTGNPGMATAGSGDVLTGVITSLLGQGLSPWRASCLGVWAHGQAGDIAAGKFGMTSMAATDVLSCLPQAFQTVAS